MLKPVPIRDVFTLDRHFEPRAVIRGSVAFFEKMFNTPFEEDSDDLDDYVVLGLMLNDRYPVALMRHRGSPADNVTIMLQPVGDNENLLLRDLVRDLRIPNSAVIWRANEHQPSTIDSPQPRKPTRRMQP